MFLRFCGDAVGVCGDIVVSLRWCFFWWCRGVFCFWWWCGCVFVLIVVCLFFVVTWFCFCGVVVSFCFCGGLVVFLFQNRPPWEFAFS